MAGLAVLAKNGQANWKFETTAKPGLNGRKGYQPRSKVLGGVAQTLLSLRGYVCSAAIQCRPMPRL